MVDIEELAKDRYNTMNWSTSWKDYWLLSRLKVFWKDNHYDQSTAILLVGCNIKYTF